MVFDLFVFWHKTKLQKSQNVGFREAFIAFPKNANPNTNFLSGIPRIAKPETKKRIAEILKSAKEFQSSVSMTLYA